MRLAWIFAAFSVLAIAAGGPAFARGPALVFDVTDGTVLYADDADDHWHPASLTKIMTAYVTFKALKSGKLKLDQRIPYSPRAQMQPPMRLGLNLDATLTVDQALKALIIRSANDVAVMLAEAVGGSQPQFVSFMNETARELGMTRTTFVNPHGLPAPMQVTTARDLAKLARAVIRDFPQYHAYWSMFDARIGKFRIASHNGLLSTYTGADGMKTGFICDSGYNVVASATRDGRQILAVVLGETTSARRTIRAAHLLEHGFDIYDWKRMLDQTADLDTMPMPKAPNGVVSIRSSVISYVCGTGPPRRAKQQKAVGSKKASPQPQTAEQRKQGASSAGRAVR